MSKLVRLSLSIEEPLFEKLEELVAGNGYQNRSEFVRDLIRDRLVENEWQTNSEAEVVGTVTLIYDHHRRELTDRLTKLQHQFHHQVMASTHLHLTHDICAEMIMVRGSAEQVQQLCSQMRQQRGVLHCGLTMSTTGSQLD